MKKLTKKEDFRVEESKLFRTFMLWCEENHQPKKTRQEVHQWLLDHGFEREVKDDGTVYWYGFRIKSEFDK